MTALVKHEEILAMNSDDFGVWLENFEEEQLLAEPLNLKECPWILIPSEAKLANIDIIPSANTMVPVKWKLGDMAIYVFGYDGADKVKAYVVVKDSAPEITMFQLSQIHEILLITEDEEYLRVRRDTSWSPLALGDIFHDLFNDFLPNNNEELIF